MMTLAWRSLSLTPRRFQAALLAALAIAFGAAPLAGQTITAVAATVVADADENGAGDNVSNPNGVPGLGSASVNSSGGAGTNGTVRFHIEWDISSLTEAVPQALAQVTTELGGFSLDTLFFAANGDGNGTIENADFETAATQIPGVLLPIDHEGAFQFDVTDELNAAIAGGFSYFVVQGRVANEAALEAGSTFDRGVQIVTTCPVCTFEVSERPQLLILDFPAAPEIPTLTAVSLLALLVLLAGAGLWLLRR